MGGNSTDVFSFNLAWSVGCITDRSVGKERLSVLERLFNIYPEDVEKSAAESLYQSVIKSLDAIHNRAESGETLRMWCSNQPDEICGLYWLMSLIKDQLLAPDYVYCYLYQFDMYCMLTLPMQSYYFY